MVADHIYTCTYMYTFPAYSVVLVLPDEWFKLLQWFTSEVSIFVLPITTEDTTSITTSPGPNLQS